MWERCDRWLHEAEGEKALMGWIRMYQSRVPFPAGVPGRLCQLPNFYEPSEFLINGHNKSQGQLFPSVKVLAFQHARKTSVRKGPEYTAGPSYNLTSPYPATSPPSAGPELEPGPGRDGRARMDYQATSQGNTLKQLQRMDWKENKPFPQRNTDHETSQGEDWPRGGLALGRCQLLSRRTGAGSTGKGRDIPWGCPPGLEPDSDLHLP